MRGPIFSCGFPQIGTEEIPDGKPCGERRVLGGKRFPDHKGAGPSAPKFMFAVTKLLV